MRKHGYWKIYGYSATCSECNYVGENVGDNYCLRCGAIMDKEPKWVFTDFDLPRVEKFECKECGCKRFGQIVFCPNCGKRKGEEDG